MPVFAGRRADQLTMPEKKYGGEAASAALKSGTGSSSGNVVDQS
jgi:hypothetical protein